MRRVAVFGIVTFSALSIRIGKASAMIADRPCFWRRNDDFYRVTSE
jgi:hypothetical protein